jgi:plastocyanin
MPDLAAPPVVTQAVLESASDGRTLRVQPTGQSNSQRLRLLGVDPPADGACYGKEAEKVLDALVGRPVLIEEDSQIAEGGGTPARYVWLVNEDGTRTLINASLVATGRAAAAELPADARFGGWLQESERMAKAAPMGQRAECGSGNGTGSAAPQATPSAQSTAVPTASPTARATADPDRIVLNLTTNDFAFSPVKLTVPANTHVTLRLVNNGGASHSFTIEELGVGTRAIGPGGTESVEFTTGEPGLYVFFCAMPGHKEQGMVGTLIVVES